MFMKIIKNEKILIIALLAIQSSFGKPVEDKNQVDVLKDRLDWTNSKLEELNEDKVKE